MRTRLLVGLLILAVSGGCSTVRNVLKTTPDDIDRFAADTPGQFLQQDGSPVVGAACLTPLLDPQDKSTVRLVRSKGGQGDYRVQAGKYGVSGLELLRIDCPTGRAVGVVKSE